MPPIISTGGGPRILPDVGSLFYNGVNWDCLYTSKITGDPVKDKANRTTKYMAWTINVDGVVTLPKGTTSTDEQWVNIRKLLSQPGGALAYTGKGFGPLQVNYPRSSNIWDSAWGPHPKVIEFTPLGASRSALIKWSCTVNVPEFYSNTFKNALLCFNSETSLSFNEKGYATYSYRGSFEIPMTRPAVGNYNMPDDIEIYRQKFASISLPNQYRCVRREFSVNEDKRTCTFEYVFEEMPTGGIMPGGLPKGATDARGSYSVTTNGVGFIRWRATLRASYVIRKDSPRRLAWLLFLGLLRDRMSRSLQKFGIGVTGNPNAVVDGKTLTPQANTVNWRNIVTAIPMSFNFTEGVYLDGEISSFECSWTLTSTFSNILAATGAWKPIPDTSFGRWKAGIQGIMGPNNWNVVKMKVGNDTIVDLGIPQTT